MTDLNYNREFGNDLTNRLYMREFYSYHNELHMQMQYGEVEPLAFQLQEQLRTRLYVQLYWALWALMEQLRGDLCDES
jgi:hypothetical protein